MAIPYPADGTQFRDDLRAAGFDLNEPNIYRKIAVTLGRSHQHARNMASGWNRYSQQARATMKALINSNYETLTDNVILKQKSYNKGLPFDEPVNLPNNDKFVVIDATDGTAVIVEIIAPFRDHTMARKLCQKLNDENQ